MGFKFRKSIKILPGVKINISKGGVSTSLGGHGFTTNISKKGIKNTVSIPNTGISWQSSAKSQQKSKNTMLYRSEIEGPTLTVGNLYADYTSENLISLKDEIEKSLSETVELRVQQAKVNDDYWYSKQRAEGIRAAIFKRFKAKHLARMEELAEQSNNLDEKIFKESIFKEFNDEKTILLENVLKAAKNLHKTGGTWDYTEYKESQKNSNRRAINLSKTRGPDNLIVKGTSGALFSISGNTMYLYPEFIYFGHGSRNDSFISLREIYVHNFDLICETNGDEKIYADLDEAPPLWAYRNSDDSKDLRVKDNYKVAAARYAFIVISGKGNISDFKITLKITNRKLAREFCNSFNMLIKSL